MEILIGALKKTPFFTRLLFTANHLLQASQDNEKGKSEKKLLPGSVPEDLFATFSKAELIEQVASVVDNFPRHRLEIYLLDTSANPTHADMTTLLPDANVNDMIIYAALSLE